MIKGYSKMKKTLAALAVLGAFAGSAVAADVTLYGLVDYGFNYQHVDADKDGQDAQDSFRMMSSQNSGSRFGLKGTEDLGNGLKVGFVLENGFNADDGALGNGGRLFGRESQVYLQGAFGTLSFGRVGQLVSANGTFGLMGGASPFSGGWQDSVGAKYLMASTWDRFDNTITYQTPSFNGFQLHAQYSFDTDTTVDNDKDTTGTQHGTEGKSSVTRYYGVAATFKSENLYLVGAVDSMNWNRVLYPDAADGSKLDDQVNITLGGAYDFQVAKVYAQAQYFMNAVNVGLKSANTDGTTISSGYSFGVADEGADGFGVALAVGVPAFGGQAKAQIGYMTAEANKAAAGADKKEIDRWNVAVGYDYAFTKRTSMYTAASYIKDSMKHWEAKDRDPSSIEVMAGLIHKF